MTIQEKFRDPQYISLTHAKSRIIKTDKFHIKTRLQMS